VLQKKYARNVRTNRPLENIAILLKERIFRQGTAIRDDTVAGLAKSSLSTKSIPCDLPRIHSIEEEKNASMIFGNTIAD
jgi:hypothetical protein